ncbi:hypothetical protein [Thalassotalea agariperforans]
MMIFSKHKIAASLLALTSVLTTNVSQAHGDNTDHHNATTNYQVSPHWHDLANGQQKIGKSHGEIDVAKDGKFYVSTMSDKNTKGTIRIYSASGEYLSDVPNAPDDFHGFVIHQDQSKQEFIYGAQLNKMRLIKMSLDGEIVMNIDAVKTVPTQYHASGRDKKNRIKSPLKLTAIAVDANDNMYVVDGYSLDYIHKFDASGNYLKTFGGQDAPYQFRNCHKIHIDPRFTPNRLMCTDRINGRLVHMNLNGELIGDYATNLRRPSAVDFYGELAAVAEISGRVSLINKQGVTVKTLGTNDIKEEINTNVTKPEKWREGVFTAPHGITFDHQGNLFITEWNVWGRIVRYDLQAK